MNRWQNLLSAALGFAIATIADQRNGYLAGVDVLIDGGSTNGGEFRDGRTAKQS